MKRVIVALMAAAVAFTSVFAEDADAKEKEKKKLPSSPKYFTNLAMAKKEAAKYEAPIFVAVVGKGTPIEAAVKKVMSHKFFKELATKGFFVYTMRVDVSRKEFEADKRTPKALFEKLSDDDQALLDVICVKDQARRLPIFGMVTHDAKEAKIKPVDMPRPPRPGTTYLGEYLQGLQSAAQAYGIDIDMSKDMRKYIENPPPEKNKKKK